MDNSKVIIETTFGTKYGGVVTWYNPEEKKLLLSNLIVYNNKELNDFKLGENKRLFDYRDISKIYSYKSFWEQ